ncbi:MAG: hypothetical protein QM706_08755 [Nitrospira sp.]
MGPIWGQVGSVDTLAAVSLRLRPMSDQDTSRKQIGVRIAENLIIEAKVLAARQGRKFNEVIEEAIQDVLKKYEGKRKERG